MYAEFYDMLADWRLGRIPVTEESNTIVPKNPTSPDALAADRTRLLGLGPDNDQEYVGFPRASSIHDTCIRHHVIGYRHRILRSNRSIGSNLKLTFLQGSAIHKLAQNTNAFFGEDEKIGKWKCLACGKTHPFGTHPGQCDYCEAEKPAVTYKENYTKIDRPGKFQATTHQDMFIRDTDGAIRVVEFKTMATSTFRDLVSPLAAHEWQVILTSTMAAADLELRKIEPVSCDYAYILYISKGHLKGTFPLKMFRVDRTEKLWSRIREKVRLFATHTAEKTLPEPHPECVSSGFDAWRTRMCPCKKMCQTYRNYNDGEIPEWEGDT